MKFLIWIFLACFVNAGDAWSSSSADIYSGTVKLDSGRVVPIDISIDMQENTSMSNSIDSFEFVGSLVIDKEGGPYPLSSIDLELETMKIEVRYQKSTQDSSGVLLKGAYTDRTSFSGDVISERLGKIGKFQVKKSSQKKNLRREDRYSGVWQGVRIRPDGSKEPMKLILLPFVFSTTNPDDYHFSFSLGKFGNFSFNGPTPFTISSTAIDYLSGEAKVSHVSSSGSSLTLDGIFSNNGDHFKGSLESTYRGNVGLFDLERVR